MSKMRAQKIVSTELNFERFRQAILHREEPDRVPLFEGTVHRSVKDSFLGRPVDSLSAEVDFWAKAGYDFVPMYIGLKLLLRPVFNFLGAAPRLGGPWERVGEWAEGKHGLVTTSADLRSLPWPNAEDFDYSAFEDVELYLPSNVKVMADLGYIYTTTWMLMGFETFCLALYDDPGLVAAVLERVGALQYDIAEIVTNFECVGAMRMPDDIAYHTGTIIHPKFLRKYVFPWHKRIGRLAQERDVLYIYHSDGKVDAVLDDIIDCGFQALHPVEPESMDIVDLKKRVGDRLALLGNVAVDLLVRGTPEQVVAETRQRLRDVAPGGGYCLGSSNSISEGVPLENYLAMRNTVLREGAYPISA